MKVVQLVVDARGLLVPSVHHLRVCVRRITGPVGTHGLDLGADPLDLALDAPPGLFDSLLSLAKRTLLRGNLICHGSLSLFSSRLTPSLDDIAEEFHDEPPTIRKCTLMKLSAIPLSHNISVYGQ